MVVVAGFQEEIACQHANGLRQRFVEAGTVTAAELPAVVAIEPTRPLDRPQACRRKRSERRLVAADHPLAPPAWRRCLGNRNERRERQRLLARDLRRQHANGVGDSESCGGQDYVSRFLDVLVDAYLNELIGHVGSPVGSERQMPLSCGHAVGSSEQAAHRRTRPGGTSPTSVPMSLRSPHRPG